MPQRSASTVTPSILFTPLSIRLFARPPATRSVNGNDLINDEIMFVMEPRRLRSTNKRNGMPYVELLELMYRETMKYIYENSHKCRRKNVTNISLIKRDILADKLWK